MEQVVLVIPGMSLGLWEAYVFSECIRKNVLDRDVSVQSWLIYLIPILYIVIFTLEIVDVSLIFVSLSKEMNPLACWIDVYEDTPAHIKQADVLEVKCI